MTDQNDALVDADEVIEWTGPDPYTAIYMSFVSGEISSQKMLVGLMPMLKKICSSIAIKFANKYLSGSVDEMTSDLIQEISILLLTKVKAHYNPEMKGIGTYTYSAVRNVCISKYVDEASHYRYDPAAMLNEDSSNQLVDEVSYAPEYENLADRERAIKRARRAVAMRKEKAGQDPGNPLDPITLKPLKRRNAQQRGSLLLDQTQVMAVPMVAAGDEQADEAEPKTLAPDNQELLDIINDLMLDYLEAARLLGIPKTTLSAYCYGRTQSVPVDVLEAARALRQRDDLISERDIYLSKSMPEIIDMWSGYLGLDVKNEKWPEILGIHPITYRRWVAGQKSKSERFRESHRRVLKMAGLFIAKQD